MIRKQTKNLIDNFLKDCAEITQEEREDVMRYINENIILEKALKDKKQLLENMEEKDKCFDDLKRKFTALRHGWYLDEDGRERIYQIELMKLNTNSAGCETGSTYAKTYTTNLQFAKLIELALQKVFNRRSVSIYTTTKEDIYNEEDNTWIGV